MFSLEALERGFVFAELEVAGLGEGGEGVVYAGDGVFVWLDVEVADCMADELRIVLV